MSDIVISEDLLWCLDLRLRMLAGMLMSGEVHAEAEADRAEVFRLLTEAPAP